MTRNQEIENLLSQVPDEAIPQVIEFLRNLAGEQKTENEKAKSRSDKASVARSTFGMIPADASTDRQALSEDLYDLE